MIFYMINTIDHRNLLNEKHSLFQKEAENSRVLFILLVSFYKFDSDKYFNTHSHQT